MPIQHSPTQTKCEGCVDLQYSEKDLFYTYTRRTNARVDRSWGLQDLSGTLTWPSTNEMQKGEVVRVQLSQDSYPEAAGPESFFVSAQISQDGNCKDNPLCLAAYLKQVDTQYTR